MDKSFAEERRTKIVEYLNVHQKAEISLLAEMLNTTEATVRRDLSYLEKEKLLHRVHGGAIRKEKSYFWQASSLLDRETLHKDKKEKICKYLAKIVHDNESLMIDGGSTTLLSSKYLAAKKNLLVVTNCPAIGDIFVKQNDQKVMITGGQLLKETASLLGNDTQRILDQYRTDKAIISVSALDPSEGIFSAIPEETAIKKIMLQNSKERILIADSSKINSRAFSFICDFSLIDILITDSEIDNEDLKKIQKQKVKVITV